ncbi:GATA transcription factor 5-like [Cynara cardunculus var. scolymus]|uniref:GATA transcription factor n=1 Tax=Cynara cardunculus var. scolymus TaxID=59895 RepID=A0A118JWV4_CYNCS|nr:GATA transcription factor 5-like [Cynara cardunculus var. scolymus]XP_024994194.1 GATA transcription factor 5-like [Cynara cardunculus var. scolymus]KVH95981.1 Transcription factor, GATA, plant [Cynara cardunculus var. scolymus]
MECIEARALKSSFLSEIVGMKSIQQASFEDIWCVAGINNVVNVSSDEFSVDDLLDLSDKDFSNSGDGSFEESSEEDFVSVSSQDNDGNSMNSGNFSSTGDLVSLTADELAVPIDDMESLEWLSQIVDDSVSEVPLLCPPTNLKEEAGEYAVNRFEPVVKLATRSFTVLGLPYPVPRKCRSERKRKAGRVWSAGSRSLTESSSSSSSSHDSSITSPMLFLNPLQLIEFFKKPPSAKKQKKNQAFETGPGSSESLSQRRCTHCQVQKTPQWRTGPLGPKTLCNACGVRFKSGRLFPEYRPACSPTFSGDVHSNSHRKVLEMRKKKETEVEPGLIMTVQNASS